MHIDQHVVGYHGTDAAVAEGILRGTPFRQSSNAYDWLGGPALYIWDRGFGRAQRFAEDQAKRGKVQTPAVVGLIVRLGNCFDLLDTHYTEQLEVAYARFDEMHRKKGLKMPTNSGAPNDFKLRYLDCAVLNFWLQLVKHEQGVVFDSVRCAFVEGPPAYPGAMIHRETHIQIAVRNPACVLGVFRPTIHE